MRRATPRTALVLTGLGTALLLGAAHGAHAQGSPPSHDRAPTAELAGTVTDTAGAPLAGVTVLVQQTHTGTGPDGSYVLLLPPGVWSIRYQATGYQPYNLVNLTLAADSAYRSLVPLRRLGHLRVQPLGGAATATAAAAVP
jgi:hypothetical protein